MIDTKTTSNSACIAFIKDQYITSFIDKQILPKLSDIRNASPVEATSIVADFFLRKSTKTLEAICVLGADGYAEDALVLVRTIYELCLHLRNIAQPENAEERTSRAKSFIYDGDRQRLEKLKEIERLKKEGKCLDWINALESQSPAPETVSIPEGFIPIKKLKDIAADLGGEMESYYYFVYWSISKLVHPSGLGSHAYIGCADDAETEASRAIAVAFTMHYFLMQAALALLDMDDLQSPLDECAKQFMQMSKL